MFHHLRRRPGRENRFFHPRRSALLAHPHQDMIKAAFRVTGITDDSSMQRKASLSHPATSESPSLIA
jgi:hypothetical protein